MDPNSILVKISMSKCDHQDKRTVINSVKVDEKVIALGAIIHPELAEDCTLHIEAYEYEGQDTAAVDPQLTIGQLAHGFNIHSYKVTCHNKPRFLTLKKCKKIRMYAFICCKWRIE